MWQVSLTYCFPKGFLFCSTSHFELDLQPASKMLTMHQAYHCLLMLLCSCCRVSHMSLRLSWKTSKKSSHSSQRSAHLGGSWAAREHLSGMSASVRQAVSQQAEGNGSNSSLPSSILSAQWSTRGQTAGPGALSAEDQASYSHLRTRPWNCPPRSRWTSQPAPRLRPLFPFVSLPGSTWVRWSSKPIPSLPSGRNIYVWIYDPPCIFRRVYFLTLFPSIFFCLDFVRN